MSVVICSKCETHIDTDYDEGYYCHECGKFSCDKCVDDKCPICGIEVEE